MIKIREIKTFVKVCNKNIFYIINWNRYTKPLSLALQSSKCDVYKAFVDAQNCKKVIAPQRSDTVFNRCIWMKTTATADSIGIELSKPRTVGRMTNRANAAFAEDSVPSYYRIDAFFPFVDHCLSELNERFPEQTRPSFLAFQLSITI